jgi:hypothetical protein
MSTINQSKTIEILKRSGWSEDRKIDKSIISELITKEGYIVFEQAIAFMQSYLDIRIIFENRKNGVNDDDIDFSFEKATHVEVPERVNQEYATRVGKKLCLIGTAYRDHMVLLIAEDGTIYAGYDSYLCLVGNSALEAIESIIFNYDFVEIA